MRIITVEEHFHHPEVMARVQELSGQWPPPVVSDDGFGRFFQGFMPDKDSAEQLGGHRLAHMDRVGIDIQVVSHGASSPSRLDHPEAGRAVPKVNDDLHSRFRSIPPGSGDSPPSRCTTRPRQPTKCAMRQRAGLRRNPHHGNLRRVIPRRRAVRPGPAPQPRRSTCPSTSTRNPAEPRCRRPITREIGRQRCISCSRDPLSAGTPRRASTFCGSFCPGRSIVTRT